VRSIFCPFATRSPPIGATALTSSKALIQINAVGHREYGIARLDTAVDTFCVLNITVKPAEPPRADIKADLTTSNW